MSTLPTSKFKQEGGIDLAREGLSNTEGKSTEESRRFNCGDAAK